MAAPASAEEFLELVRKSGVVDEKRLDAYAQQLRAGSGFPDEPGKMAGLMVRDGLLTHFQAEQVLLGKWRRFTIGKYKVLERLGSGGMGSVYLCEHKFMRRRVAVKVLPAAKAEDPASLERFYREARAAAALDHPNIVRAYDIDQDENLHFLVMEYVDGASLQEIIKRAGPMTVLRAAHYIRQAAVGMQHAHEAGLVHRDIKPGNLLVDRTGTVKVLDMGLARFFHDEEDILTKKYDESVLGTADYLAPEQALDSHGVDIRADIYSLGATFYFCLTGQPPFNEGTVAQKLIWHQTRQPKPIRSIRQDVPEAVATVIDRMMTKDRAKRYQTPAQVADALAPLTTKPIPPPPENEMPRLSPAAMGAPTGETTATLPPAAPTPRATPASTPASRPVMAPAAAARAPAATPEPQRVAAAAPRPQVQPQARPTAPTPPGNGTFTPTPTPTPAPAPRAEEAAPNWGELVASTPPTPGARSSRAPKKTPVGEQVKGFVTKVRERPRFWLPILGGGALLALIILIWLFSLVFGGKSNKTTPSATAPASKQASVGKKGEYRTIREALLKAPTNPGDRLDIFLLDEQHEELLDLKALAKTVKELTVSIQPDASLGGKRVVWRPPPGVKDGPVPKQLLLLSDCPGLTLKGVLLNGQNTHIQIEDVLTIFGRCPGLKVEDVHVSGFHRSAVKLINCSGEPGRPVVFKELRTLSPAHDSAAAVMIEVYKSWPGLTVTDHLRLENCRFDGPCKTGIHLFAEGGCDIVGVDVVRSRFFRTGDALLYKKQTAEPVPALKLTAESNTLCEINTGLHLEGMPSDKRSQVLLKNNLFLRTHTLGTLDYDPQLAPVKAPPESPPVHWIWYDEGDPAKDAPKGSVLFRKTFTVPKGMQISNAQLEVACDDTCTVWINGNAWHSPQVTLGTNRVQAFDVTPFLQSNAQADTPNLIAVHAQNNAGPAGLLVHLTANPNRQVLATTDGSWKALRTEQAPSDWHMPQFAENDQWKPAKVLGAFGKVMSKDLVWELVVREQLRKQAQKVCPVDAGNARDAAGNADGSIVLKTRVVDANGVNMDVNNDAQFLRYPRENSLSQAGTPDGPVGAPPVQ